MELIPAHARFRVTCSMSKQIGGLEASTVSAGYDRNKKI